MKWCTFMCILVVCILLSIIEIDARPPERSRSRGDSRRRPRSFTWYEYEYVYEDGDCTELERHCKRSPGDIACSGHGVCFCGECLCNPLSMDDLSVWYSGDYCECDNYSCPLYKGKQCGGSDRGTCECGECKCSEDFHGPACDCALNDLTCIRNSVRGPSN